MAVRVAAISSLDSLFVTHKGSQYSLVMQKDGVIHVPFAYALSLTRQLKPIPAAPPIPFLRTLRANQIAPCMVMKLRINVDGYVLNAQGCADGKTTQAYWLISQLKPMKALFVTHRTVLLEQIVSEGQQCTGMIIHKAEKPEQLAVDSRLVVVMVHVMHRLPKAYLESVDLLIVDECDRVAGPEHGKALLYCTPKRILGMTATPGEMNSRDVDPVVGLLYGLKPILPGARKPFKVVRILYPYKPPSEKGWYVDSRTKQRKFGVIWKKVLDGISGNHNRNLDIVRLVRVLLTSKADAKVFVLLKYKCNVKAIADILEHIGMRKNVDYALVYGDEEEEITCCRIYVGTYSKGEAGFDENNLRGFDGSRVSHVILGIDVVDPRQAAGRGNRYLGIPCVWEILDDNDIIRGPHAANREKWYNENGAISIKTIELRDLELGDQIAMPAPANITVQRSGVWPARGGRGGARGRGRGGYVYRGGSNNVEPP